MAQKPTEEQSTYKQPNKQAAREAALKHAVNLLTKRRQRCAILPSDYISRVVKKMAGSDSHEDYQYAAAAVNTEDIKSWQSFRRSAVAHRTAAELTVAYLAGPEPTNDLETLICLGVRPENIWAFEVDGDTFSSALAEIERSNLRGVKLMKVSIEEYFMSTPRRFDIIYFDACGPLPSKDKKTTLALVNIFRHSALSPLGVLITNFSAPDVSKDRELENYSRLVASYLYPKAFLDAFEDPEDTLTSGAQENAYSLPICKEDYDEEWYEKDKDFLLIVKNGFLDYYGSFLTRHIVDIASIIAPTMRLLSAPLHKEIVRDIREAVTRGHRLIKCQPNQFDDIRADDATFEDADDMDGEAYSSSAFHSLLYTMAVCGLMRDGPSCESVSEGTKKFCAEWKKQLAGKPSHTDGIPAAGDAIACFYALRRDKRLWAAPLQRLASFDYWERMRFLCDVPTEELAFYPAFAQVAYPAHNNVRESKRFSYVAEGKKTTMLLDVLPFDECRYVYDWLSTAPLIGNDWKDESRQLVFRFALDGIAKNLHYYQDDFLYGCHAVSIDQDYFEPPTYALRKKITAGSIDANTAES
jgi:hypothetical protein